MRFPAALILAVSGLLLSSSSALSADGKGKWTRCSHARYKAQQIGKMVVVVGYGTHRTSGYKVNFRRLPIEIYPPQFEFLEQKPTGFTLQVITPFAEVTHFAAHGTVKSVVIHDGNGKHTVKLTRDTSEGKTSKQESGYLKADGTLASQLILKDSQSGFAGVTGSIWTIEPDGSWRRQTFLNRMVRKADRSGKLTKAQLKRLADVLKANQLRTLPSRLGGKPMVNPKVVSLTFGKKESNYMLRGGGTLPKVDPKKTKRTVDERFAAIVQTVSKLLTPKTKD